MYCWTRGAWTRPLRQLLGGAVRAVRVPHEPRSRPGWQVRPCIITHITHTRLPPAITDAAKLCVLVISPRPEGKHAWSPHLDPPHPGPSPPPFPHFFHTPAALKLLQKAYPTLAPLLLLGAVRRLCTLLSDSPEPETAAAVYAPVDGEEEEGAPLPQRPPSALLAWALRLLPR